ncbi:unnamed protein product [Mytilus coruscus]|uniref:Reverse transcriptase domain-containing protein n=1 Tax=Mytilus coruscus TaxID=42192 RepID=A0A6J8CQK6_MYTCO|nr:unnamed protein product [Mytilus coruscus]
MNNVIKHTIDEFSITKFNGQEILKAIARLNLGKTANEYSLTPEHFKYVGRSISPYVLSLFNNIMQTGKDSTLQTNYRGITVTSALGKIFEYAILDKMTELNNSQSDLQFGFTQGLSPIMAALLVGGNSPCKPVKYDHASSHTLDSQSHDSFGKAVL